MFRAITGQYEWKTGVAITEDTELWGIGAEPAVVVLREPLRIVGVSFTACDIVFHYWGPYPGNVVEVTDGVVHLENCTFTGGLEDEMGDWEEGDSGCGLVLKGKTKGVVKACTVERNKTNGIVVDGEANVTLVNNQIIRNGRSGLVFAGNASGRAHHNLCMYNKLNGITVDGEACPVLYSNRCRRNKWHGLAFYEFGAGVAKVNRISGNGRNGIFLSATSNPTLIENAIKNHRAGNLVHRRPLF